MKPLVNPPCDYCGKPVLTTAWNRPVFCHDDCAEGWLVELRATDQYSTEDPEPDRKPHQIVRPPYWQM